MITEELLHIYLCIFNHIYNLLNPLQYIYIFKLSHFQIVSLIENIVKIYDC